MAKESYKNIYSNNDNKPPEFNPCRTMITLLNIIIPKKGRHIERLSYPKHVIPRDGKK